MALTKTVTLNQFGQDIVFENAYIKITRISGDKENVDIVVVTYSNNKEYVLSTNIYTFKPSVDEGSENFIKQGYEYIKTLEEYQDTVDVLEDGQAS